MILRSAVLPLPEGPTSAIRTPATIRIVASTSARTGLARLAKVRDRASPSNRTSDIDKPSISERQNAVGPLRDRRAVRGDQDAGATSHRRDQVFQDQRFCRGINLGSRLIADQHLRIFRQNSRKGGSGSFTARQ